MNGVKITVRTMKHKLQRRDIDAKEINIDKRMDSAPTKCYALER